MGFWILVLATAMGFICSGFYIQAVVGKYNSIWYVKYPLLVCGLSLLATLALLGSSPFWGEKRDAEILLEVFVLELVCFFVGSSGEQLFSKVILAYFRTGQLRYYVYFGREVSETM